MLPAPEILAHIVDVHCHPQVAPSIAASTIEALPCTLCAMSTQREDQPKVAALARARPDRIVPAFGYHPWWAHRISLNVPARTVPDHAAHYRALFLPDPSPSPPPSAELEAAFARLLPSLPPPIPLADVLADVRAHLIEFPAAMLGEVGIDRAARIPFPAPADAADGGNITPALSPFSVPFAHQLAILEAQLALAVELRRNVSLHSVKAPSQTRALFDRMAATHGAAWFAISVDVHSCTLSPEVWCDIEKLHPNVYISLSTAINGRSPAHIALIRASSPTRILVESDYHNACDAPARTWDMARIVADTHGWSIEDVWDDRPPPDESRWGVVRRLEANWHAFVRGGHQAPVKKSTARERRWRDYSLDLVEIDTEDQREL
ncbi:TatD DNase family Scn1 [Russula earlei]|uniref:TatD DNase family Scn1 n=1 Tax=Russula earlei TaxID=71964 RepID=A0ACC0TVA2_9AGAM|nr:TatD DNase family Scn1 [Russula earlei]